MPARHRAITAAALPFANLAGLAAAFALAACSADGGPPQSRDSKASAAAATPDAADAAAPAQGAVATDLPSKLLAGSATATDLEAARADADRVVAALIQSAAAGDVTAQGRAPAALARLGKDAVPGLLTALGDRDERHRRIAALTLLQLALALHAEGGQDDAALTGALAAAAGDPDPAVAAAAKHALRRVTGDTSALAAARAAMEAAEKDAGGAPAAPSDPANGSDLRR